MSVKSTGKGVAIALWPPIVVEPAAKIHLASSLTYDCRSVTWRTV
jgi:hypothetical protein